MKQYFAIFKDSIQVSDACEDNSDAWLSQPSDGDGCTCEPVYVIPVKEYEEMVASVNAAINWIENCSTPLDSAKELRLALDKFK